MEKKHTLTLDKEFILYCELNNIKDINKTAQETFNRGFSLLKYGETPMGGSVIQEVIVEKEIIVDREIRVPYEVIKEVRVEVPVEIIKEVTLQGETIVNEVVKEIINTQEVDRLTIENNKLKEELNKITTSLESLNQNRQFKNTENKSLYDE
jgi:hypothetical protein